METNYLGTIMEKGTVWVDIYRDGQIHEGTWLIPSRCEGCDWAALLRGEEIPLSGQPCTKRKRNRRWKGMLFADDSYMAQCIYSVSKRAKNHRDRWSRDDEGYVENPMERRAEKSCYRIKDILLLPYTPCEVHSICGKDYLLYRVAGYTFHQTRRGYTDAHTIVGEERAEILARWYDFADTLPRKELLDFCTRGADTVGLVPSHTCRRIAGVILKKMA